MRPPPPCSRTALRPRVPGASGIGVRPVREVDHQVDEHHPAERGDEEAQKLRQDQAIELTTRFCRPRTSYVSVAPTSDRPCIPAKEMRAAAP